MYGRVFHLSRVLYNLRNAFPSESPTDHLAYHRGPQFEKDDLDIHEISIARGSTFR
jgi:hypothetical protein